MKSARKPADCRLYAILDAAYLAGRAPESVAAAMIAGGVDLIQIRAKDRTPSEIAAMGRAVAPVARAAGIPVVINDHPEVALEIGADGVHLGQEDGSVDAARRLLGEGVWIGKSTHSLEQALAAEAEGVDYIGVGPVYATPTKPDYQPVGLELVRAVSARVKLPFFCIGGIKLENAVAVLAAGAERIVVVSGILQAPDPTAYCRGLKQALDRNAGKP